MRKFAQTLGALALLFSSVGSAASLTVVPSKLRPSPGGEVFTVTLTAADIVNIGGITLAMTWDSTKASLSSWSLPAAGPVAIGTGTFLIVNGSGNSRILDILPGAPPVNGNFDVAVLTFTTLAVFGPMNLVVNDDGGNLSGWFDNDTAEPVPTTYIQTDICMPTADFPGQDGCPPPVPAPPAVWLLGTALAGLGGRQWLRRKLTS